MILYGDGGESGKIYLTPSDGTRFEAGKQYRVSVNIKDIGKVFVNFFSWYAVSSLQFEFRGFTLVQRHGQCWNLFGDKKKNDSSTKNPISMRLNLT